jgi:Kef-type K+ transport system membrane component KefB
VHSPEEIAALVFLDIAVIVVVARLMGALFRRLRQPPVVGEILAGIALGPSLLGQLPGDLPSVLFPLDVRPYLSVIAQLGLVIFMFIVGLELDVALIRGKERAAATISLASVALPFALGIGLAALLHGNHGVVDGEDVPFLAFALFIGASMSVTAFPVLARILTERGMHRTAIGALALACAAVDDVLAWSMLAVVLAVAAAEGGWGLPVILGESLLFVIVMFLLVKPRLRVLVRRYELAGRLTPDILAVVIVGFLLSAFITEEIGIHAIFGAFLFGVVMPREAAQALNHAILDKLEQVSVLLLLPVFFIATGLNVDIGGLDGRSLFELAAVLLVACAGKFVGAAGAARLLGMSGRRSSAIGILMNTRGLTELVILNIGLAFGVLTPELFTILVLMAIFTTIITEPLLRLVYPDRLLARDIAEAEKAALGLLEAYRVLSLVPLADDGERVVDTSVVLLGDEEPAELVLSRFEPPAKRVEVGSGLGSELLLVTESLRAMQGLVRRAREQGAAAVTRSQFSDDVPRDLFVQSTAVEADVVLLTVPRGPGADLGVAERLLETAECTVVLSVTPVSRDAPLQAVATAAGGGDEQAAAEQAARIAARLQLPLLVLPGADRRSARRSADLVARLSGCGVDARAGQAPLDSSTLLVLPMQKPKGKGTVPLAARLASLPEHRGPLLLVRASSTGGADALDRLIARRREASAPTPSIPEARGEPAPVSPAVVTGTDS